VSVIFVADIQQRTSIFVYVNCYLILLGYHGNWYHGNYVSQIVVSFTLKMHVISDYADLSYSPISMCSSRSGIILTYTLSYQCPTGITPCGLRGRK